MENANRVRTRKFGAMKKKNASHAHRTRILKMVCVKKCQIANHHLSWKVQNVFLKHAQKDHC